MTKTILMLFALLVSFDVLAVYRCDTPDGVTYSDTSCRTGKATDLSKQTDDSVSQRTADDARTRLVQQKKEVERIEAARAKEEKEAGRVAHSAYRSRQAEQKKCAALMLSAKWAEEDAAASIGKVKVSAQKKARRLQEKHALTCGR